jgi:hypothetical protein
MVSGCLGGQIPGSTHQARLDHIVIDSGPNVPDSLANAENMQNMLREMRLLTEQGILNPRQQAK